MQAHLGKLRAGAPVKLRERVLVLADRQQGGEVPDVLLEEVEHRGDPAIAEPHPRPHPLLLQLHRPGVRGLLEQRDPGLLPQPPAEQERGIGGQRDLDARDRLGGVPVVREGFRGDLDVQLHAGAGGFWRDAVGVGDQPLRAVDLDAHVLTARREDLLVDHLVPRVRGQDALVQVALLQRRQDADHDEVVADAARLGVRVVQAAADLLLQACQGIAVEPPRRHVDLEVELAEFGRPGRVGDGVEHVGVLHGRSPVVVHQVQLDLQAHLCRVGLEQALAQHPGEHLQRALELVPVLPPVLATDLDRLNVPAHAASAQVKGDDCGAQPHNLTLRWPRARLSPFRYG